jgi:hypothetical protein
MTYTIIYARPRCMICVYLRMYKVYSLCVRVYKGVAKSSADVDKDVDNCQRTVDKLGSIFTKPHKPP